MSFPFTYQRDFTWSGQFKSEQLGTAFLNMVAAELQLLGAANVTVEGATVRFSASPLNWILKTRLLACIDNGSIEFRYTAEGVNVRVCLSLYLLSLMHLIPALGVTAALLMGNMGLPWMPWIFSLFPILFFGLVLAANYWFTVTGYPRFIRDAFVRVTNAAVPRR